MIIMRVTMMLNHDGRMKTVVLIDDNNDYDYNCQGQMKNVSIYNRFAMVRRYRHNRSL